ncbi:hypothetical protein PAMP_014986 [Pampus punctatissimus]
MGKVNVWVRRIDVVLTSLMAIISALLLAVTVFSHGYYNAEEEVDKIVSYITVMYAVSIITLVLAIIGLYGSCKEKEWALIVFAVGIILCAVFMFEFERQGLANRSKVSENIKVIYLNMLPLNNASKSDIEDLNYIQMKLQCCGLDEGYLDWDYNIPTSCLCFEDSVNPCVEAPKNSGLFEHWDHDQPVMIYKESCLPYLIDKILFIMDFIIGTVFGLILLWISTVMLCIIILCQLRRNDNTPAIIYSSEAKTGKYTILTDPPEYI